MSAAKKARKAAEQIEDALLCQSCRKAVEWGNCYDSRTGSFGCPHCGTVRTWSRSADWPMKFRVFTRDGWLCHRCGLPVDGSLPRDHPFGAVADHHPVPRLRGGPTIDANLKLAHYVCNGWGGYSVERLEAEYGGDPTFSRIIDALRTFPRDAGDHIYQPRD